MPRLSELDTIIFDLGEVIIDLDVGAVVREFERLTGMDGREVTRRIVSSPYIFEYETGKLSCSEFVASANRLLNTQISEDEFRYGWNLMIKNISQKRLSFLEKLMETHQVLLLSNTNKMHEVFFDGLVTKTAGRLMKEYAHTAFYSHHIGYRKPNRDIYEFVIQDQSLNPRRTIFLDDRIENIEAAQAVGLQAKQVKFPDQIFELLKHA